MNKKALGHLGEELAAAMLCEKGYQILERNWSTVMGELDVVAKRGQTLLFAEVKTRTTLAFGRPSESVDERKQQHIRHTAIQYIKMNRWYELSPRFDVIEIYVNHIEGAL